MLSAALLAAVTIASEGAWTQILITNHLQCKSSWVLTVGHPQGRKELVIRIEKDNEKVLEQVLPRYTQAEVGITDIDESGCDEALIDLTDDSARQGIFVSFPGGQPKITLFPLTTVSAEKAKRFSTRIRVYGQKKKKICVTDYRVQKDALVKMVEDCY